MPTRTAEARWQGTLQDGAGTMRFGSGAFEGAYTYASRFEDGEGTNPEELLGAAHAGCFSMSLARRLEAEGYPPERIHTEARVRFGRQGEGYAISRVVTTPIWASRIPRSSGMMKSGTVGITGLPPSARTRWAPVERSRLRKSMINSRRSVSMPRQLVSAGFDWGEVTGRYTPRQGTNAGLQDQRISAEAEAKRQGPIRTNFATEGTPASLIRNSI
jgi:OsmC subfamily peroxiredoxin